MVLLLLRQEKRNVSQVEVSQDLSIGQCSAIVSELVTSHSRASRAIYGVEELLRFGVTLDERLSEKCSGDVSRLGRLEVEEAMREFLPQGQYRFKMTKNTSRNGIIPMECHEEMAQIKKLKEFVDKQKFGNAECFVPRDYNEKLVAAREIANKFYPQGLPDFEPLKEIFSEYIEDKKGSPLCLWFANNLMDPECYLRKYSKGVQKTKLVVYYSMSSNSKPETRCLTSGEQEEYHRIIMRKRQEEELLQKDFEEHRDTFTHFNSSWTDPNRMHKELHSLNNIKFNF